MLNYIVINNNIYNSINKDISNDNKFKIEQTYNFISNNNNNNNNINSFIIFI